MPTVRAAWVTTVLVGVGGFAGAVLRYGLSGLVHRQVPWTGFPLGTLAVNLLGCLAIGLLAGLADSRQLFGPEARAFALIGLVGGFTTFSTFGYETFAMLRDQEYVRAAANVTSQVVLGLSAVWAGYAMTTTR